MLLRGRHTAMPLPGAERCMVETSSFNRVSLQAGVTTENSTAFSVASRPR